ncbi:hypothetical protein HPULCUR_011456 [Helicostylum pulchrum]|uniref:F-box domain-containing protein n=1 Tax=Helicostylum pulchrum TaxID=562976 RepID=A0ABP9YGF8_9FUNG
MPRDGWNNLPTDVLRIVFYHLEKQVMVSTFPMKFIGVPSRSLLQCQLTCKNWSSLAQSRFYKCVILKKSRQLNLLVNLDGYTKDLVHHIMFNYITHDVNAYTIITSFHTIALHFKEINNLYTNFSYQDEIWKAVKRERSEGRFAKLHVIPFKPTASYNDIVEYNDTAWDLRDNLRKLEVYDVNPVPTQNTERLSHFASVDAVYFKLRDFNNVYTVDQQIKKAGSVRSVDVVCVGFTHDTYHMPVVTTLDRNVHVLPYIKQLDVRRFLYDCNIYSYVMQVFPNLDKISLTTRKIPDARIVPSLSTDVAIRFLKYLLRIPLLYVTYIPFDDLEQVLMEFYDHERTINQLDIQYTQNNGTRRVSAHLSMWTYIKDKINIEVNYGQESPRFILPRIGMLEQNGKDFQHIKMDMGYSIDDIKLFAHQGDQSNDRLSNFFSKCPNLKTIYIACTLLHTYGTDLEERKIPFLQEVELNALLVYSSFLLDMSCHLPFIDKFSINNCRFDGETEDNVSINMPYTKFTSIIYIDSIYISCLYLKLSTVGNNTTRWFVGNKSCYNTCTENEYQNSLRDKNILSLFIQCKQVDCIRFSIFGFNLVIKTV